jgi:VCBS repeat-containing protein
LSVDDVEGVLANDTDPDDDPLTAVLVSEPSHGVLLWFGSGGEFIYLPELEYVGSDSFTYQANDGVANSFTATVTITVTNATPVANGDSYGVHEDGTISVSATTGVLANDTDADGDPLSAALISGPMHGTLTLNEDGSFTYTPEANYSGADSFMYQATDSIAQSTSAAVTLNVHADNDAPVANDDSYSTPHNTALTVYALGVLGNDTDPELDPLSAILVSGPSHGTVTLNSDGSFTYEPDTNFAGTDSFTYKANDGADDSAPATVTIEVTDIAPNTGDDSYVVTHDQTLALAAPGVLGNDSDPDDDPLTAELVAGPANGTLTLNTDGSFEYIPGEGFAGTDSFTYVANDGVMDSDTATVIIDVTNTAPIAVADLFSTPAGQELLVSAAGVLGNDYDADEDSLTAGIVSAPSHGSVTLNSDGSLSYTPDANFTGADSFTYEVSDGIATSDPATVTISVVGTAPIANDDIFAVEMNGVLDIAAPGVLWNDARPPGSSLTVTSNTNPSHGSLTLNSDGSFTYTPEEDFDGEDTWTYFCSAGGVQSGEPATVRVQLIGFSMREQFNSPFIPINANNHNGSSMFRPELPRRRDFNYMPAQPGVTDPDIKRVDVTVNPNMGPGFFVLSVVNDGTGQIRLWRAREKGSGQEITAGAYTAAALPRFIYVEGLEPSANENDVKIRLQWFHFGVGVPTPGPTFDLPLTVTPVITASSLATATGGTGGVRFVMGNNGLRGMAAGQIFANAATGNPGAKFSATLRVSGLGVSTNAGGALFVQNFLAIDEGAAGAHVYNTGQVRRYVLTMGGGFRLLDKAGTGQPPPPDYNSGFGIHPTGATGGSLTITDGDTPTSLYQAGGTFLAGTFLLPRLLTNVDFTYRFRVYLMWRWGAAGSGIIYTLATAEWQAHFVGGAFAVGQGVTSLAGSAITADPNFTRSHSNPVVQGPTFNVSAKLEPG